MLFATAAPAFAASTLLTVTGHVVTQNGKTVNHQVSFQTGNVALEADTGLRVTFVLPSDGGSFAQNQVAPSGWTVTRVNSQTVEFKYNGTVPLNSAFTTSFAVERDSNKKSTIDVTVYAKPVGQSEQVRSTYTIPQANA